MTPQEKIKNNEFLLSLDMANADREQKLAWLSQIIENEIEKSPEEQDLDLIAECTEYMQELCAGEMTVPTERKEQMLLEVKARMAQEVEEKKVIARRPRVWLKVMSAAAAVLILMFSTLTVAAKVGGYSNAFEFLSINVEKFLNMKQGDTIDENGITWIKGGESISYPTIEDLLVNEKLDILYPSQLPNATRVTQIMQQVYDETCIIYAFVFDDATLSMIVSTDWVVSNDDLTSYEVYNTHGHIFYIKTFSNGTYQAIGHDEKYEYNITYSNYDELKNILDNMKGIEQ